MARRETLALVLHNRHTGERLALTRVMRDGQWCLHLDGSLPPRSQGPPLHIHHAEDELGRIKSGTLCAVVVGERITAGPGETRTFPRGSRHRWWNDGDEILEFEGWARPLVDLDRYLQAVFEVLNAGPPGRPPIFYLAHVSLRHRRTQEVILMPRRVQAILFRLVVALGTMLGRYRGTDWPGCPARCLGAPPAAETGEPK